LGAEHLNFFSGTNAATEVLLSITGLNVRVTICAIRYYANNEVRQIKKTLILICCLIVQLHLVVQDLVFYC
jgi:hypothetical protein